MLAREICFVRKIEKLAPGDAEALSSLMDIVAQNRFAGVRPEFVSYPPAFGRSIQLLARSLGVKEEDLRAFCCGVITQLDSRRCTLSKLYANRNQLVCLLEAKVRMRTPFWVGRAVVQCLQGHVIFETLTPDGHHVDAFRLWQGDCNASTATARTRLIVKPKSLVLIVGFPLLTEFRSRLFRFRTADDSPVSP